MKSQQNPNSHLIPPHNPYSPQSAPSRQPWSRYISQVWSIPRAQALNHEDGGQKEEWVVEEEEGEVRGEEVKEKLQQAAAFEEE